MLAPKWKTYIKKKTLENRVIVEFVINNRSQNNFCKTVHYLLEIPASQSLSSFLDKRDHNHNNQLT